MTPDTARQTLSTAVQEREFITRMTARFRDSLSAMLRLRSDMFSFEFPIGEIPAIAVAAKDAGFTDDTLTLMCFVHVKSMADPVLEAMQTMRGLAVVETGDDAPPEEGA